MAVSSLVLLLLTTGLGAGFLAGLLGVGGGVVLVPALIYIFSFYYETMSVTHMAIGTSLAVIVPTGLSSALAHYRHGHIDFVLLKTIGAGILGGVLIGTLAASALSGETLRGAFGFVLLVLSLLMFKKPRRGQETEAPEASRRSDLTLSHFWRSRGAGVVIGAVSSLIGIGGASLSVPYMVLHDVPAHRAVGTAAALGLVIALPAALGFMFIGLRAGQDFSYAVGYVNYAAWLCIVPASVMAAPLGALCAKRLPVDMLRRGFAVFLLFIALRMIYGVLYG